MCGSLAGSIGAAVANPTDVVKVRMQVDGARPGTCPRYRSTLHAFTHIYHHEGLLGGLYKGVVPTVQRAAILSAVMMPAYDSSKHYLLYHKWLQHDNLLTHACCGMISGLCVAVVTTPVDVAKTRIMNVSAGKVNPYTGVLHCMIKTYSREGLLGLYKGFLPTFFRLGFHTIAAFVLFEQLRKTVGMRPI